MFAITAVYTHDPLFLEGELHGPGWYCEIRDAHGKIAHVTRIVKTKLRAEALAAVWVEEVEACC